MTLQKIPIENSVRYINKIDHLPFALLTNSTYFKSEKENTSNIKLSQKRKINKSIT